MMMMVVVKFLKLTEPPGLWVLFGFGRFGYLRTAVRKTAGIKSTRLRGYAQFDVSMVYARLHICHIHGLTIPTNKSIKPLPRVTSENYFLLCSSQIDAPPHSLHRWR